MTLSNPLHGRTEEDCGKCSTLIRDSNGVVFCASPRCGVAINDRAHKHNARLAELGIIAPSLS